MVAAAKIETLIDKFDTVELVRDQIAAILLIESTKQQELAQLAAKDPALWKLRIYTERTSPWDVFIDAPPNGKQADASPLVNVCWDSSIDDEKASDPVEYQKVSATFNLDCYGCGVAEETADGHNAGDQTASLEASRAARLVRNILMAGQYTYLGMRGVVGRRWRASAQAFQPPPDIKPTPHVHAVRVVLKVDFDEFSPQVVPKPLELLTVKVKRAEDGKILFNAHYLQESDS